MIIAANLVALGTSPAHVGDAGRPHRPQAGLHHRNIICAVAAFVYFWSISTASIPLIFASGILFMTVGYGMVNPLGPAMTAEMFPTRVRYTARPPHPSLASS